MNIHPIRSLGYYLGYLVSFLSLFPRVLFDDSETIFLENPYLMIFAPLAKLKRKKVIAEYVDYYPANLHRLNDQRFFRYLMAKVICKNFQVFADFITTESQTGKRTLITWGVPENKIIIIPVGINTTQMKFSATKRARVRKVLAINENAVVIGYLGKMVSYYNIKNIIHAIPLVKNRPESFFLLFIGDGPERQALENLCQKLSLPNNFVGNIDHQSVIDYYSAMDIFLFPLNSLAIKLGEVLSASLPLIVVKGMAEDWIIDGENGIVAESNSPIHLKLALEKFLKMNKEDKQYLREKERAFALSYLSTSIITKMYLKLILS